MNDKENQIRELAEIIEKRRLEAGVTVGSFNEGAGMWYARDLYMKGYRKQSDTAREILEVLKAAKGVVKVHFEAYDEVIDSIAAQYGVELKGGEKNG